MKKLLKIIANILLYVSVVPLALFLAMVVPLNIAGLLFGFEKPSPICNAYKYDNRTRLEYVLYFIGPYACKEDAGLLQPMATNVFEWLNSSPKQDAE